MAEVSSHRLLLLQRHGRSTIKQEEIRPIVGHGRANTVCNRELISVDVGSI